MVRIAIAASASDLLENRVVLMVGIQVGDEQDGQGYSAFNLRESFMLNHQYCQGVDAVAADVSVPSLHVALTEALALCCQRVRGIVRSWPKLLAPECI